MPARDPAERLLVKIHMTGGTWFETELSRRGLENLVTRWSKGQPDEILRVEGSQRGWGLRARNSEVAAIEGKAVPRF